MSHVNPYASPEQVLDHPVDSTEVIKKRLLRPAMALIIMASTHSVFLSIGLVAMGLNTYFSSYAKFSAIYIGINALHFICLILIAVGAAKMGHLESRTMGRIGAVLACIPLVTPFGIMGIPFGIWSLVLLRDPEVAKAFDGQGRGTLNATSVR